MRKTLLLCLLAAACHSGTRHAARQSQQPEAAQPRAAAGDSDDDKGPLTGLYASGAGKQINQLCLVQRKNGSAHFGIVVWGANLSSCSGIGSAMQTSDGLRLEMAGDSPCTLEASFADGKVTLPRTPPAGCSYYCGARASLAAVSFGRKAAGRAAALKATDLVGDPLCSSK